MSIILTTYEYFFEYINFVKYSEILTNTHVLTIGKALVMSDLEE